MPVWLSKLIQDWRVLASDRGSLAIAIILAILIGAAVYYFQAADTFWEFVLAVPKALIWPGVLVYELFKSVYGG